MCTRLQGVLFSALVIAVAAADDAHARRYPSPASPHAAVVFRSPASADPAADDASPGPFKIPNTALEPAGWGREQEAQEKNSRDRGGVSGQIENQRFEIAMAVQPARSFEYPRCSSGESGEKAMRR
jgi:hypothetical protein